MAVAFTADKTTNALQLTSCFIAASPPTGTDACAIGMGLESTLDENLFGEALIFLLVEMKGKKEGASH